MGIVNAVGVCDYDMMKEMLSNDAFSGRPNPVDLGMTFLRELKGGHGTNGLILAQGSSK
jgi:hypothetical protein